MKLLIGLGVALVPAIIYLMLVLFAWSHKQVLCTDGVGLIEVHTPFKIGENKCDDLLGDGWEVSIRRKESS